jgi:phytoene dehydrogenase-like protein
MIPNWSPSPPLSAAVVPQGLYSASAGTFPAGSVMGCAGHNAAATIVRDMGLTPHWPTA